MSFNQHRTNPSQAVSKFKGRTETPRAWPSTAVSTWMNGGLFGGASTPQWELLSSFNPTSSSSGFELDMSAYKIGYACLKIEFHAKASTATNSNNTHVSCQRQTASGTKRYARGSGFVTSDYYPNPLYNSQNNWRIWSNTGSTYFIPTHTYEWWGVEDSTLQNTVGTNYLYGDGYNSSGSYNLTGWSGNTTLEGDWSKFRIYLGSSGGTEVTASRFVGSKSRFMVWGLKAQREALV